MSSEVARVKAEIQRDMLAMHQALHGLRQVGGHDFITARSDQFLAAALNKLIPVVGTEEEAMQTLCVIYVEADNQEQAEEGASRARHHHHRERL